MSQQMTDKLIDLEIRLTHQEDYIDQLSTTIYEQQKSIDQLHIQMNSVIKRLKSMIENNILSSDDETPPPHY